MADNAPPIPRNRPTSQYVPPSIPSNRPKSSYKSPFGSISSKIASSAFSSQSHKTSSKPTPVPKPRTSWGDDSQIHHNHVAQNSSGHSSSWGEKPKPLGAKPTLQPKPHFDSGHSQMKVTVDTSGASKAMFHAAMDPQQRSKAMTKEQEKDAAKLGWGVTKNAAKTASMDDFKKASQAANNAPSGKSSSAAFGASLFSSAAKKDKPVMTGDQKKQAAKLSFGIGKNLASHVTMKDVKKASSFVSVSGTSNNNPPSQPIVAHRPAPTLPPSARARPRPAASSGSSSTLPPPQSSSLGSVPLQTTSQPRSDLSRTAYAGRPSGSDQSKAKTRPTIIRPGQGRAKQDSTENNNTKKMPPPRPSGGPAKKGAPPRPSAGPKNKSKRPAPKTPSLLEKHGLASLDITSMMTSSPHDDKNLPPRPGPGHPLYKHTVSQPHAIAQFDFEAQDKNDLSFKAEDVIILTKKLDADWYIGRCGSSEGMFPAQFVRVVRDITEDSKSSVSSPASSGGSMDITGPSCVAKFEYKSDEWDDLSFPEAAVIRLLERVDADWLKGEYNGQSGMFPQGYVDIIEDIPVNSPQSPALSLVSSDTWVTALYDFDAEDFEELSFRAGDVINVTGKLADDWLIGTLSGKEGRFPANFVDGDPVDTSPTTGTALKTVDPHAFVQHDFVAEGEGELSLTAGETVVLLERVGTEWLKGRYRGREGIFPISFVEVIVDLPQSAARKQEPAPPKATTGLGKARYKFEGEADGDLSFREGDTIELVKYVNEEWMVGRLQGKTGQFPVSFIEIVKPLPS